MKEYYFIIFLLFSMESCSNISNSDSKVELQEKVVILEKKRQILKEPICPISRDSLNSFLKMPFDLIQYKNSKKRMANSSGSYKRDYFFRPKGKGVFYSYFLFRIRSQDNHYWYSEDGVSITVYKRPGKYQYKYNDPTEELIEVLVKRNDYDLPELRLIGMDSTSIVSKFGKADAYFNQSLVYQYQNNVLILKLKNHRIEWIRYTKLKDGMDVIKIEELFKKRYIL